MIDSVSAAAGGEDQNWREARRRRSATRDISADRLPPHSIEAEQGVLGCVMLQPKEVLPTVVARLKADKHAFYDLRHGTIFEAMMEHQNAAVAVDLITMQQALKDKGLLEQIGGIAYLNAIQDSVPSAANLEYYLDYVFEKWVLRRMIHTCTDVVARVYDYDGELTTLVDEVQNDILNLPTMTVQGPRTIKEFAPQIQDRIEHYARGIGTGTGLPTGFRYWDKLSGGMHNADMIILGGDPGAGKTSLAMNVAERVAMDGGNPVGVLSLEMSAEDLILRLACSRARVNFHKLRTGMATEDDLKKLIAVFPKVMNAPIIIDDSGGLTLAEARSRLRAMKNRHNIRVAIIDYLQLMPLTKEQMFLGPAAGYADVARGLQQAAKELQIPLIVLSQLSNEGRKRGKNEKPKLTDFRETGAIGDVANFAGILWRKALEPEDEIKQREAIAADPMGSGADNLAYSLLLNATGWQKGLFTQLNYGFWPVNFLKDTIGFMMQMPGVSTPYHWAKHLPRALVAARQSVTHSKSNPWADAALRRKMLISKGDPRGVWAAAENEFEMKLASFGMDPVQWNGQKDAVHRLVKLWDWYKNLGQTTERINKISGMLYLDEKFPQMPEWKKREIIRERSGSPNFLERGASNPAVDLVALFYNPWKESIRSVTKAAKENPWSFTAKATTAVLMPTVLQAAAVNGWLGEDRKEQYASIPDYDLTNYLTVPLGWVDRDQRKVAYLRLPLWEPARLAHGMTFQALTGRGQGIAAHAGGQVPGLNPLWKIGGAWLDYMQGKNPIDSTRGVNVMSDKVFAAGGPATLAEMAKYSWNEAGGSIIHRFRNANLESSPESEGEKFLRLPGVNNALGRWIKVSDRGLADQQRTVATEVGGQRAEVQLGVDEILRRMTGEGSWEYLQEALKTGDATAAGKAMAAAQLTDAEKMLMRDPYALEYFTRKFPELVLSKANINVRLWFNAQSNEERAKLLQQGIIQPSSAQPAQR